MIELSSKIRRTKERHYKKRWVVQVKEERAKAPFGRKFYEENATLVNEQAEIRVNQIMSKLEEVRPVIKMDRKGQYIA